MGYCPGENRVYNSWLIFKDHLFQAQEWSVLMSGKSSKSGKKCVQMNKGFLTNSDIRRRHERWKQDRRPRDTIQACRNKVMNAKACLVLHLAKDMKDNKKGFCKHTSNNWKTKEKREAIAEWSREHCDKGERKCRGIDAVFALDFSGKTCLWQSQVSWDQ